VEDVDALLRFDDSVIDHKRGVVKFPCITSCKMKSTDAWIGSEYFYLVKKARGKLLRASRKV